MKIHRFLLSLNPALLCTHLIPQSLSLLNCKSILLSRTESSSKFDNSLLGLEEVEVISFSLSSTSLSWRWWTLAEFFVFRILVDLYFWQWMDFLSWFKISLFSGFHIISESWGFDVVELWRINALNLFLEEVEILLMHLSVIEDCWSLFLVSISELPKILSLSLLNKQIGKVWLLISTWIYHGWRLWSNPFKRWQTTHLFMFEWVLEFHLIIIMIEASI